MSIFDSIMGDMSSFGDALSSAVQGSGLLKGAKDPNTESDASANRSLRLMNLLEAGKMQMPYQQGDEFKAAKTKPAEGVDSDAVNQRWLQRLDRYSAIAAETGVKH